MITCIDVANTVLESHFKPYFPLQLKPNFKLHSNDGVMAIQVKLKNKN